MNQHSKNRAFLLFLLASGLLLSACQANWGIKNMLAGKTSLSKSEMAGHSELALLLGYFRFLDSLSTEALALEVARSKKTLAQFHDPIHRLRLAMLLSLPPSNSQEHDRALELLRKNLDPSVPLHRILRDFSLFLSASIRQLKTQDEHNQDVEKSLLKKRGFEEIQGERLKKLEDRVKTLSQQLEDESAQRKKLQEMIDGLKVIEKNIIIGN